MRIAPARSIGVHALALVCALGALATSGCEPPGQRATGGDALHVLRTASDRGSGIVLPAAQLAFLTQAAQSSLFEIEASRIAIERGGAPVRRYAEVTLRERVSADADLEQLATSVGLVLPSRLRDDLRARLAVLAQLTGGEFDRAYAHNVGVLAQDEALAAFEQAADRHGARVQRFAAQQIPALREHLEWARHLAAELDRTQMT